MSWLDKLLPTREEHADVSGDEPPPEAADFPTTDPSTTPPDEGDGEAEGGGSYV